MRNLRRALLASGLGFAVSCLAACGSGAGLLSGDQANTLNNTASQISADIAAGRCDAAQAAARALLQEVGNLPSTVNGSLRQDLDLGATQISQLTPQQCHRVTTPTTTATTTSTPTTTATTTTTTPTTTTPTTTTTATTTTPTGTTTGSSGGGGLGGGGGGGSGGGSGGGTGGSGGAVSGTGSSGAIGGTTQLNSGSSNG